MCRWQESSIFNHHQRMIVSRHICVYDTFTIVTDKRIVVYKSTTRIVTENQVPSRRKPAGNYFWLYLRIILIFLSVAPAYKCLNPRLDWALYSGYSTISERILGIHLILRMYEPFNQSDWWQGEESQPYQELNLGCGAFTYLHYGLSSSCFHRLLEDLSKYELLFDTVHLIGWLVPLDWKWYL